MQLKLSVGVGDTITIDVQPTDTFQDLSERLFSLGNVKVDLNQLRSSNNDKPFDMSTNVIEYFTSKSQKGSDSKDEFRFKSRLCRLCMEPIPQNPYFLFDSKEDEVMLAEKVNEALPIHVTVKDALPKQICSNCVVYLNKSYDFMKKVLEAQKALEKLYNVNELETKTNSCCPLCSYGNMKNLHKKTNNGPNLPRKENVVKKEVVISVPRNIVRKDGLGHNAKMFDNLANIEHQEYFFDDEVVTGYWDPGSQSSIDVYGSKKYRKRIKLEDDADWTIDEEYVPVNRRGRPKGTKNKPKVVQPIVEKSCALCGWLGADTDIFAHAINQHCQPDMGYFPCPLCKTNQVNEMVLETHIDRHNVATHKSLAKDK
ncbi:uncharacterized protein LOC106664273 isoform X2 [Cimex lectularius]|uniref:ZAD domain-containing protein n=1 Tax=Cimex lectularius TaxID=79782 RepID=A0A8I6RNE0_CIMLE|nr:uncharacterized protein LOC106664273 isoform X2 [Cimex lectularius]